MMGVLMKKIPEEKLASAIVRSIENYCFQKSNTNITNPIAYRVKYFSWILMLIVFSPRMTASSRRFITIINPIAEKRFKKWYGNSEEFYQFARLNDSIKKIRKNRSVLSSYSFIERLCMLYYSLCFCYRYKTSLKGYFHFGIEYYFIAYFLDNHNIDEIVFQGIFDRYNTLISNIGKEMGIHLVAIQDGACISCSIPQKIYCDEMKCFDKYEEIQFRRYIANDCKYSYIPFESMIHWEEYNDKQKQIIAVASQDWYTEKTIEIIDNLMKTPGIDEFEIIVFPHYREKTSQYRRIVRKYHKIVIEPTKRYYNIDVLITFYSTIVYDYLSLGGNKRILCLRIPGFEPAYYNRNEVVVCETIKDLMKNISK